MWRPTVSMRVLRRSSVRDSASAWVGLPEFDDLPLVHLGDGEERGQAVGGVINFGFETLSV